MMALRVDSQAAIDYWLARFDAHQVRHGEPFLWHGARPAVHFWDPEGQRLMFISDEGTPGGIPWQKALYRLNMPSKGFLGRGLQCVIANK
jgi:glyoxalase family protein